ncbi:MAG TPA: hypothetical protein VMB21_17855, partial [Candidatus Limnocylindria bacterium]|nr:hypothetical protein [Candidatus Limnocylindria bacterium]
MKSLFTLCLALSCLGFLAHAEKTSSTLATNIPGAFGVVFGKPLPSKVGSYTMDSDLEVAVRIKPPTPSPYLNSYFAKVN